jgi:catechol 2,3-dioxygenase
MSRNARPAPKDSAGLFHLAILYPERRDLAQALRWLVDAGHPIDGASDHGVSEALYLTDPDGNGVELYRDRPEEEWPRTGDGGLAMVTRPLDVQGLLAELDRQEDA